MMRVTIACPEAQIGDANQLALCLGLGPEDAATYGAPDWLDAGGNRYALASAVVGANFATAAGAPLIAPAWGADMQAAARAQGLIRIANPEAPETCKADPAALIVLFGDDPWRAIRLMGLERDPEAEA
jgi:hypothetical protein